MESLLNGEILDEDRINSGFYWGSTTGIYYANMGVRGSRWLGMRSRAPPVADAARRSTRSGQKIEQASSTKIFSGAARRWGQMLPQATFGAHLCAVRICFSRLLREKQHSYPAQPGDRGLGAQPQAYFGSFCTHKRNAPAASRTGRYPAVNPPRR